MHQIDGAALAKAKRGPALVPLLLGVVLIGGAAGWYFMGMPGLGGSSSDSGVAKRTAVVEVAGNLLEDPSFESQAGVTVLVPGEEPVLGAWNGSEASAIPFVAEAWRYGGDVGLGVDLEAGEGARVRSAPAPLGRQRNLAAHAMVIAEAGGVARIGVELTDSAGEHPVCLAWSPALQEAAGDALQLELLAPVGYDLARLVLDFAAPTSAGSVGFDDVSLVAGQAAGAVLVHGDFSLADMGPGRLALGFIDRPLLVDVTGTAAADGERGVTWDCPSGGFGATLDAGLLNEGLATLGDGGYRPHGDAFEDAGVTSVVIGSGVHQMLLGFSSPVSLAGRPVARGYRIEATGAKGKIKLELGFVKERAQAARLHTKALAAEEQGRSGEALALWRKLLDDVPFDGELVLAAEAGRGRLIAVGLERVGGLRGDFERASFFGLPDLYRECLDGALALAKEFKGSEVEGPARKLASEVSATLQKVDQDDPRTQRLRAAQEAVLGLARTKGLEALATHMQAALSGAGAKENN